MASNKSRTLEDNVLNFFLRANAGSISSPGTVYAALFTSSPTKTSFGTEVSSSGYSRVNIGETSSIGFSPPSSGSSHNLSAIQFPTALASWGTVVAVAILDHASNSDLSNILYWGDLTESKTVGDGDTVTFNTGALTVTET